MTDKKTRRTEPGAEQTPGDSPATGPGSASDAAPETLPALEELQSQLAEARSRVEEYKDGWQRAVAEFQNFKRRVEAERDESHRNAVGAVVRQFLPVLDDLERALAARPADLPWADGIELICRKMQSILEAEGVIRIEAEGRMFDPNFHEAITHEPSDQHESGQVIAVVQHGYLMGERVLRPAVVRVAQ